MREGSLSLWLKWLVVLLSLTIGGAVFYKSGIWAAKQYANKILIHHPEIDLAYSTEVYDRNGKKIGEFSRQDRYFVALNQLPKHLVDAFLATEDREFFEHSGYNFASILRASLDNLRAGRIVGGASTITQQLARMLFLTREKTVVRKLKELALAIGLENRLGKKKILELYLNKVFLGNNSYGVEAAARNYFRKSVSSLNVAEAAMLAGLPQAPSRYAPHRFFGRAKKRQAIVLKRMVEAGSLRKPEMERWKRHVLKVADRPLKNIKAAPYFFAALRRELDDNFDLKTIDGRGLKIFTSLDQSAHREVEAKFDRELRREFSPDVQMAIVVLDATTGGVLALRGGSTFRDSQFNRAVQARRPLGSAYLPIFYALALEREFGLASSLYEKDKIVKVDPDSREDLSLFEGLVLAKRWESARLMSWLGLETVRSFGHRLGLNFRSRDLSLALGKGKSSLLRLSAAYNGLLHDGLYKLPYLIEFIKDREGKIVYARKEQVEPFAVSRQTSYLLRYSLAESLKHRVPTADDRLGGMVGVDKNRHDAWFVGFLPGVTVGIWLGSEKGIKVLAADEMDLEKKVSRLWNRLAMGLLDAPLRRPAGQIPEGISFGRFNLARGTTSLPVKVQTERNFWR